MLYRLPSWSGFLHSTMRRRQEWIAPYFWDSTSCTNKRCCCSRVHPGALLCEMTSSLMLKLSTVKSCMSPDECAIVRQQRDLGT